MKEAGPHALLAIYSRLEGGYAIDVITQQKGSIVQSKLFAISQVLHLAKIWSARDTSIFLGNAWAQHENNKMMLTLHYFNFPFSLSAYEC